MIDQARGGEKPERGYNNRSGWPDLWPKCHEVAQARSESEDLLSRPGAP
jgi:hypothetical protein